MSYHQYWKEINELNEKLYSAVSSYWTHYSDMETWQFWVVLLMLIIPLIILCFAVDRSRIFEMLFFGYTVHILWAYSATALERKNMLFHPHFLTPLLPMALSLTASVLPVGFLLLYQYCTNHKKNYYLYSILLSLVFAFGLGSLEDYFGFIRFAKGINAFWLFIIDIVIAFIAYWFTLFIHKQKRENND